MSSKPLVSVVIIFLNAEPFIQEAIESVLAQTYAAWDLWLVDDGSSDGSSTLARQYAARYPDQVHYLDHPAHQNQGMSASRNLGVRQSRGPFIAFLDADDVWLPHKLEQQVRILEAHPDAAMVYGLSQWWYSWGGPAEEDRRDFVHDLGVPVNTVIEPPGLMAPFFFRQTAAIPCPSSILVRREALEAVGGFEGGFRGIYSVYEDQAFYAKLCLKAPVFAADQCWDRYRQHPRASCAVVERAGQAYTTRLYFMTWLAGYLAQQGVKDESIWRALGKEMGRCRHPALATRVERMRSRGQWLRAGVLQLAWQTLARALGVPAGRLVHALRPVRWGSFRRVTPFSREFGFDRGQPVDRYYMERFLASNQADIRGHVLEIGDDVYTRRFGGRRVTRGEVLHLTGEDGQASLVADLTRADHIPSASFDCVILTQTLQFILDAPAALRTIHRILKPGGVVLATVPGISQISRYDMDRWGQFWSFTTLSAQRLFEAAFPEADVEIHSQGNVLAAVAFLHGLAVEELSRQDLEHRDPDYEVLITIRAVKPNVCE